MPLYIKQGQNHNRSNGSDSKSAARHSIWVKKTSTQTLSRPGGTKQAWRNDLFYPHHVPGGTIGK